MPEQVISSHDFTQSSLKSVVDEQVAIAGSTENQLANLFLKSHATNIIDYLTAQRFITLTDQEQLLNILPPAIDIAVLSDYALSVLELICKQTKSDRIADRIFCSTNLESLSPTVLRIMSKLAIFLKIELALKLIPLSIPLDQDHDLHIQFLAELVKRKNPIISIHVYECIQNTYHRLNILQINSCSPILLALAQQGLLIEIEPLFPDTIALEDLNRTADACVALLISNEGLSFSLKHNLLLPKCLSNISGGKDSIIAFISERHSHNYSESFSTVHDFSQTTFEGIWLIKSLKEKGLYSISSVESSPDTIEFSTMSRHGGRLFEWFHESCSESDWLNMLPKQFNWSTLSDGGYELIRKLIDKSTTIAQAIASRSNKPITNSVYHNPEFESVLEKFLMLNLGDEILSILGSPMVLPETGDHLRFWTTLAEMLNTTFRDPLIQALNSDFLSNALLSSGSYFLSTMYQMGFYKELGLLADLDGDAGIRKAVDYQSLFLHQKVGPSLLDQMKNFPISPESSQKLTGGWFKATVFKPHDRTKVIFYFREANEARSFSAIFRVTKLSPQSLVQYEKAFDVMPLYVGSANYPELTLDGKPVIRMYPDGFREVYLGSRINELDYEHLPNEVVKSIIMQKEHILYLLECNNIHHNHPFEHNMNVRFLLTDEKGNQSLCFDVNEAIQMAINKKMQLTPIVVLRDWDLAG